MSTKNPSDDIIDYAVREGGKYLLKAWRSLQTSMAESQQTPNINPEGGNVTTQPCQCKTSESKKELAPIDVTSAIYQWLAAQKNNQASLINPSWLAMHIGPNRLKVEHDPSCQMIFMEMDGKEYYIYVSDHEL